jgi:hypothetical protein
MTDKPENPQANRKTLRDEIAIAAMQAMINKTPYILEDDNATSEEVDERYSGISYSAYLYADAMLKERAKL